MNLKDKFLKFKETNLFQSFLLAFSQSLIAVFFLLIDFFYSKKLSIEEFGVWKKVFFIVNFSVPILSLGIAEGYKYYLAKGDKKDDLFSNTVSFYLIIGFIYFSIIFLLNSLHYFNILDLKYYYLVSLLFPLTFFVFNLNKVLRYTYINQEHIYTHTVLTVMYFIVSLILLVLSYICYENLNINIIYLGVLLYIVLFGLPIIALVKKQNLTFKIKMPSKEYFYKVLKQGLPLYLATFVGTLMLNTGSLIVNHFEDESAFAIFSVGAMEIPIFAMLSAAFSQKQYPILVKYINNNEKEKAKEAWIKTTLQVSFITYPILLLLMFFADDIIFFIYDKSYKDSVFLFKTFLLIGLFRNNYYGALITASGNAKYILRYALLLLGLNLVLSLTLYYFYGLEGIVFGNLISVIFISLVQLNHEDVINQYINKVVLNKYIFGLVLIILLTYLFR